MAKSPLRGRASHVFDDHPDLVDFSPHRHLIRGRDAEDGGAGPVTGKSGAGGKPGNAAPTDLVLSNDSVAENAANGTVVGTVTAVDPDSSSGFSYSLTDSAGGRFAINSSTGLISVANGALLDFESATSHTITVKVRDNGRQTYSEQFRIDLIDQPDQAGSNNHAPTDLALAGSSVDENAPAGTVVGTVTASDPDAGETFTYSLTDTAGGRFAINASSGLISVANGALLDYKQAASHRVTVKVTDHGGLSYSEAFTIAVRDVAEGGGGTGDVDPTPPPAHVDDGLYYGDPYRWNAGSAQGSPATVKYTFLQEVPGYYAGRSDYPTNFAPFSEAQKAAARDILAFVQNTTNLTFVETADINQAQMTFGLGAINGNWGYAWRPFGSGVNSVYGDVWINNVSQTVSMTPGSYGKYLLTHEIGHALGLKHPALAAGEDSQKFTVMSYNYYQSKYPLGYQVYDQAVLQQLYGTDSAYRSGDDTYTVTSSLFTIQDQGGIDTLIGSGKIDLNAGRFSGADTWAIAYGTTMENAVGGSGNDVIIGNEADNRLTGGAGADTFVFEADWNNDVITDFQDGIDRIEFRGTGFTFAQLALSTGAGGAVVAFGDDDITLAGFDLAFLTASDFLFS